MSDSRAHRRAARIKMLMDHDVTNVDPRNVRKWLVDGRRITPAEVDVLNRLSLADVEDAAVLLRVENELDSLTVRILLAHEARRVVEQTREFLRRTDDRE